MGIGPVFAVPKLLRRHGLSVDDIDLWELNEAFASQALYCRDTLGIPMDRMNVNGGSIAIGHPFGMTGSRLVGTLANALLARKARYGVVTMCVGGGQGAAALFEACSLNSGRRQRPRARLSPGRHGRSRESSLILLGFEVIYLRCSERQDQDGRPTERDDVDRAVRGWRGVRPRAHLHPSGNRKRRADLPGELRRVPRPRWRRRRRHEFRHGSAPQSVVRRRPGPDHHGRHSRNADAAEQLLGRPGGHDRGIPAVHVDVYHRALRQRQERAGCGRGGPRPIGSESKGQCLTCHSVNGTGSRVGPS